MPISAKDGFNSAMDRANHLLILYAILHNTRTRVVRNDWAKTFKQHMQWPLSEQIVRVDGENSLLILRESAGIDGTHFAHDYLSELLRATIVAAVSALDRYMHDMVVERSLDLLRLPEEDIPKELRKLAVPILSAKKALEHLRKDSKSKPGNILKQAIQAALHEDYTFQSSSSIEKGAKMLGIKDFWGEIVKHLPNKPIKGDVQKKLKEITTRRNQIGHEADLILKTSAKKITVREIKLETTKEYVSWIRDFVSAINEVASETFSTKPKSKTEKREIKKKLIED